MVEKNSQRNNSRVLEVEQHTACASHGPRRDRLVGHSGLDVVKENHDETTDETRQTSMTSTALLHAHINQKQQGQCVGASNE
ncbi:unnamed protein product, partial [Amoebophrya sp. A25]|eukprot:GSA25T00009528001.1